MNTDRMEIAFLPAPDEGGLYRDTVQRDLNALTKQLSGPGISHRGFAQDAVDAETINLGEIIVKLGLGVIGGVAHVASTWIKAKAGRKVRMKVGEIEVEAGTPEELQQLWEKARQLERDVQTPSTKPPASI